MSITGLAPDLVRLWEVARGLCNGLPSRQASYKPLVVEMQRGLCSLTPTTSVEPVWNGVAPLKQDKFGQIGYDAAWKMPRSNNLDTALIQPARPSSPIADILPFPEESILDGNDIEGAEEKQAATTSSYASATSLRLVNRTFNQLVTPVMYEELNLLINMTDTVRFEKNMRKLILPHAHNIRSLYIWGNSQSSTENIDPWSTYGAAVLRECIHLNALGVYFQKDGKDFRWNDLREAVLPLMEQGNLSSLGFYFRPGPPSSQTP
ncbi:hypothetical protein CPB86DRAFT_820875 [Serendipita vermifera]|nr:hypothetical protein CPB86DRAFT_820875 [Serendipita vermifera]